MHDHAPDHRPQTLHARIRAEIEARILSGEWPPGYRIPPETELVATYGCSRMTVNKAMSSLAAEGSDPAQPARGNRGGASPHAFRSSEHPRHPRQGRRAWCRLWLPCADGRDAPALLRASGRRRSPSGAQPVHPVVALQRWTAGDAGGPPHLSGHRPGGRTRRFPQPIHRAPGWWRMLPGPRQNIASRRLRRIRPVRGRWRLPAHPPVCWSNAAPGAEPTPSLSSGRCFAAMPLIWWPGSGLGRKGRKAGPQVSAARVVWRGYSTSINSE